MKIEDWMINQQRGNRLIVGRLTRRDGQVSLIEVDMPEFMVKAGLDGRLSKPIQATAVPLPEEIRQELCQEQADREVTYEDADL